MTEKPPATTTFIRPREVSMFQSISNSWQLVKASFRVLQADKELMVFPLISSIGVVIVTLTFLFPMLLAGFFESVSKTGGEILGFLILFLFYIVQYTVIFFANTALVGAAMIRLKGGDPTVSDGVRIASSRFGAILGYALISATVGMILRAIANRGWLGNLISSLFGLVWNVATFLVVPILAIENVGPIDAVKRSIALLKKTWGEQIAGNLGLGAVFGLVVFGMIIIAIPLFYLAITAESAALIIALIVIYVLAFVLVGLISSTLSGIYTAAVYQYATEGQVSGFFDQNLVQNAFKQK
jgi:hypothetical protein